MQVKLRTSVGRRLLVLVVSQTIIVALMVFLSLRALRAISNEVRYIYGFQLSAIEQTSAATRDAANLARLITAELTSHSSSHADSISALLNRLKDFSDRYKTLWEAAHGKTADAVRFRNDLRQSGNEAILDDEARTLADLQAALRALAGSSLANSADSRNEFLQNTLNLRKDLYALHNVNVRYAQLSYEHILARARTVREWFLAVGLLGTSLTLFLGLYVHRAIAPRVRRLVDKVQRFREFGVNEKIIESGSDEIAVLANALDAGFSAIAEREREREEFLSVAAHELKTPITSIHGYSKLLLDHPERTHLVPRALEIIYRQSWRLSRMVEHVFLAMRARGGQLQFEPNPLDLSQLVQRVLSEVRALISNEAFRDQLKPNIKVLGDETLLEHALQSLFASASALSKAGLPVNVALDTEGPYALVTVDVEEANLSTQDIEALFVPFHSVQFENESGIRAGVGLYLCREIVRLHNGRLRVHDLPNRGCRFSMEIAR
jgi:signal transduction histidine kinase